MMEIGIRPLPLAEQIVEATGLKVTYPFDDLIFVETNAFLLRFNDEKAEQMFLHFNDECDEEEKPKIVRILEAKAYSLGMQILVSTNFHLEQEEGAEDFQVVFSS